MAPMQSENTPSKDTPQFQHDCDCCHFLGRHVDPETSQNMDLYAHTRGNPTVIARTGIDGDYMSGLPFAYGSIAPLTEARRRAQSAGVLPYQLRSALAYTTPEDESCIAELKEAITMSLEWRAVQAFESNDVSRSQALVNTLVDEAFTKNKERDPSALRLAASFDVTNRIDKMLQVMHSMNPLQSMNLSQSITEFVWKQNRSSPGALSPTA